MREPAPSTPLHVADPVSDFTRRLSSLRVEADLSYQEMSARSGIPRSTLHYITTGRGLPRWIHVEGFLKALNASSQQYAEYRNLWEQARNFAAKRRNEQGLTTDQLPRQLQDDMESLKTIHQLIESLRGQETAIIRLSRILFVKHRGEILVQLITEGNLKKLDSLIAHPDELIHYISKLNNVE